MAKTRSDRPIAVTIGEPAGIGPDIALAAWRERIAKSIPPFFCIGDLAVLRSRAKLLGWDIPIELSSAAAAAGRFDSALPVVPVSGSMTATPADPQISDVPLIIDAIDRAVEEVRKGHASAVVTNPINKHALKRGGFTYPGHTEYLGHLAEQWTNEPVRPIMMIAGPDLRTVPVTIHTPLADVPRVLTSELIIVTGQTLAAGLEARFGLTRPRIVVAGLNPHAGENGAIGNEDETIVRPAVEALRALGIDANGPLPADTLFHAAARTAYDAALCMYHDQALIPAKTLAFDHAVNVTLGLPFIRTSPDHGTAFDIAGSGRVDPTSMIAALRLAATMSAAESRR